MKHPVSSVYLTCMETQRNRQTESDIKRKTERQTERNAKKKVEKEMHKDRNKRERER